MLRLALLALALPASAVVMPSHEELRFIGWNDGCSVAIEQYRFPALGEGLLAEPSYGRIGTVSLDAEQTRPSVAWVLEQGGKLLWNKTQARATSDQLARAGYSKAGYREAIRPEPAAKRPGLDWNLRSTATFEIGYDPGWAPPEFALSRVYYSPLATCAFMVFERRGSDRDAFRYQLVRTTPPVRRQRSQWHLTNGILLYTQESDMYGGLDETRTAAEMDPRLAEARFQYARLLAAHGRFDEAIAELKEAVILDRSYSDMARKAVEFDDVRGWKRFKEALR